MKKLYLLLALFLYSAVFSQSNTNKSFHDTQGNIEVNGSGQLQFTLPIALPPGVKSVAPQVNLVYTSGSGNGIAGYGWNLSGITAISRIGKNIDKDGKVEGIQLNYNDYYSFNGQRLILKSGEYGKDGAEYTTEKFSNVKIKSVGSLLGKNWQGPESWEVTFEDGSQAWYGVSPESKNPIEYNITNWKDAQGNYITYQYTQQNNVAVISRIQWGGNESLNKSHFNEMIFNYSERDLKESSYVAGERFIQSKILNNVQVNANGKQFKKYVINYNNGANGTKYQFVENIVEYNSNNEPANPVTFEYENSKIESWKKNVVRDNNKDNDGLMGDFNGDGKVDILKYSEAIEGCVEYIEKRRCRHGDCEYTKICVKEGPKPAELYMFESTYDNNQNRILLEGKVDFTKEEFKNSIAIALKDKNGIVKPNQGFAIYRYKQMSVDTKNDIKEVDIEVDVYSINDNILVKEYTKIIPNRVYNISTGSTQPYLENDAKNDIGYTRTNIGKPKAIDFNGDGISELIFDFKDKSCRFEYDTIEEWIEDDYGYGGGYYEEVDRYNEVCVPESYKYVILNLDHAATQEQSISTIKIPVDENITSYKIGDFNGDGFQDFLRLDKQNRPHIIEFSQNPITLKYNAIIRSFNNGEVVEGLSDDLVVGDFNGDGKSDLLVPQRNASQDWYAYISTGRYFNKEEHKQLTYFFKGNNIISEDRHNTFFESGCHYYTMDQYSYMADDLNNDGKAELISSRVRITNHQWRAHYDRESTGVDLRIYSIDSVEPEEYENPYDNGFTDSWDWGDDTGSDKSFKFNLSSSEYFNFNKLVIPFGTISLYNNGKKIVILGKPDDCKRADCESFVLIEYNEQKDISKASRIKSITQGGLRTEIDYKELDPRINPDLYKGVKKEPYPYMEMDKVSGTYAVAQLRQIISENQIRKQDFRYRGFIAHLKGKGMIGFRKTARSSWYADGFENTKVWSGAEIDPLNEGLPIKEWSIKTNNESEIFPTDLSLGNKRLLSLKTTNYKVDKLLNGVKISKPNDADKPRLVTAIVPTEITTKDFIKNVVSVDRIEYNELYLPVKTISNTNNGFAEKITTLDYYPSNLTGVGKDYSVGRPRSKEELVRAYGDSKGAKEEYHYENNLLKTLKTYNRDNSGYLQETYTYDGFGNVIQKVISNSVDSNTQTTSSQYDDKGRFVIEKTDNLGLVTRITYNDWGQVLTQTDPLGNTLTNTYDAWGKQLTAKTNLGGTTRFAYNRLENDDINIAEIRPDGSILISLTNKIGQNYKSATKAFKAKEPEDSFPSIRGNKSPDLVSKEIVYDVLGRKIKESEPYFEGERASKWNTIEYDEYSRPIKAISYTGKIVTTKYTSNTVTVTETNAYNKFKKQTFDALGNIISTEDKGGIISFKYNAAGENIESIYGNNIVTTQYDAWGRKVEFHDPSNGVYRYEYNGFGQQTKIISPKGEKIYDYNDKGQLVSQREISKDGKSTNKDIQFIYNSKGLLIAKIGESNEQRFRLFIKYDNFGRVISTRERSYDRTYAKKNIVYDNLNRVVSYEKSLTSSGKETKAVIEHVYDSWSGVLYQIKDKETKKVLWELKGHNAKGQVTSARLGGSEITNIYDANGFLSYIHHEGANNSTILNVSYSFNAIKNELNSRTTGGDFNIIEDFKYDDNNRLVNWRNPVTNKMHYNGYDKQGRIVENDQLGKIKFGNANKVYQPTGATLNSEGEKNIKNNLIQHISYNENNDPIFIDGVKGDVRFEYGLTAMRQMVSFGGEIADQDTGQGKYTRYYSEDGSYEVTVDNQTGKEKHILYIGGSPYESDIIYLKDYNEQEAQYRFLHKDYLGSILAISDEAGNKIEQRHYDAWGNLTHLQFGKGEILTGSKLQTAVSQMLIDRGYTSHEHFFEVGIIHMNGRLYDPLLRRFLNADEFIQDSHNTQNYNKYGYVFNNPLMYNDPNGEFVFAIFAALPVFWGTVATAAVIGAAVGVASYTIGLAVTGNLHQWSIGGALKSAFWGAVSGAVTAGLGELFSSASVIKALGDAKFVFQAAAHGVSQGVLSVMQGGDFLSGFAGGALGSLGAELWGGVMKSAGLEKFAGSTIGTVTFGALSGGIGAELTGGNFWQGAVTGGIVAGLNHAMHKMGNGDDPPKEKSNKGTWDLDGDGEFSLSEANNWYQNGGGKEIYIDASKIDLNFVDTTGWKEGGVYGVQTLLRSKNGRVLGNITVKYLGDNKVIIFPDVYNFEYHKNSPFRNFATTFGKVLAGKGTEYKINFIGINSIKK